MPISRDIPVDPLWMSDYSGDLASRLLHVDEYFASGPQDSAFSIALDHLVEGLSEEGKVCLDLKIHGFYSYGGIARQMGWFCGDPPYPDRKKAWRVVNRALRKLRREIGKREWLTALAPRPEVLQ